MTWFIKLSIPVPGVDGVFFSGLFTGLFSELFLGLLSGNAPRLFRGLVVEESTDLASGGDVLMGGVTSKRVRVGAPRQGSKQSKH